MKPQYRISPEVVDKARERLGLSSDEKLAVRLGISTGTISRVRRGETGVNFSTGILLLNAAGVAVPLGIREAA